MACAFFNGLIAAKTIWQKRQRFDLEVLQCAAASSQASGQTASCASRLRGELALGGQGGADSSKQRFLFADFEELLVQSFKALAWVKKGTIKAGRPVWASPRSNSSAQSPGCGDKQPGPHPCSPDFENRHSMASWIAA